MILDYEIPELYYVTEVPLTAGNFYKFKVQSRNLIGFSDFSEILEVFAAQMPDQPEPPVTSVSGQNVVVTWVEPNDQGAEILGYRIEIRNADELTWTQELDHCTVESNPAILTDTTCSFPITSLIVYPYYLPWGSKVLARVQAFNSYGDSYVSNGGAGAFIYTNPDPPKNLRLDPTWTRTSTQLKFEWDNGLENGGTPIVSYRIYYDQGVGVWTLLVEEVFNKYYLQGGLAFGKTYKFRIQAKTAYAYSADSEVLALLCAAQPSRPGTPQTYIQDTNVVLKWTPPSA